MMNFKNALSLLRKPPVLNNTIWLLGCSHVWGTALEEQDTIPYILQELTGLGVDNLGIEGGSPDLVHDVLIELLKIHRPMAVIISWPKFSRTYTECKDRGITSLGPWVFDPKLKHKYDDNLLEKYKTGLMDDSIASKNLYCMNRISSLLSCPYYSFSFLKNVKEFMSVNSFIDFAPDGKHPGPISNRLSATVMAEWVNSELK